MSDIKREIQAAYIESLKTDNTVKFKALLPGQRFATGMNVNMIKLKRTKAGITDAAGNVYSVHVMLPNERVTPAPAMVAHPTGVSRAAVTMVQETARAAEIARMRRQLRGDSWDKATADPLRDMQAIKAAHKEGTA